VVVNISSPGTSVAGDVGIGPTMNAVSFHFIKDPSSMRGQRVKKGQRVRG